MNAPRRRYLRAFLQILARCIDIHLRSPLQQIIENIGVVVASKSDGAFFKARERVHTMCITRERNTVLAKNTPSDRVQTQSLVANDYFLFRLLLPTQNNSKDFRE